MDPALRRVRRDVGLRPYLPIVNYSCHMNLGSPIRDFVPSLDADVYRVLATTTGPTSARRIRDLAGIGSHTGVQNILRRLVSTGLVLAVKAPPAVLYSANRQHLAWPAIEKLALLRPAIIECLTADIAAWQPVPRAVALYGSVARSDGNHDSDIDLFIVADARHAAIMQRRIDELATNVRLWTGNDLQAVMFTPADVNRLIAVDDATYANIRREGIILAGTLVRK